VKYKTTILTTNRKKKIRGGMLSFSQAKKDLELLMRSHSKKTYEKHFYTTMFDMYALPGDFPGHTEARNFSTQEQLTSKSSPHSKTT
jgi:hypothetical protein